MGSDNYQLDNQWEKERERLSILERTEDPATINYLGHIGVNHGWECLEVGGGGGSIASWLCQHVGNTGRVVATDIDTRFLDTIEFPNLEVWQHNAVNDDFGVERFDLIHARSVLAHLPQRREVLGKLIAALKPGGWLLIEDFDWTVQKPVPDQESWKNDLFFKFDKTMTAFMASGGYDPAFGLRLRSMMKTQGVSSLSEDARVHIIRGGTSETRFHKLTFLQIRDRIIEFGSMTESEVDGCIALLDDPDFGWSSYFMVSVWGQKPR